MPKHNSYVVLNATPLTAKQASRFKAFGYRINNTDGDHFKVLCSIRLCRFTVQDDIDEVYELALLFRDVAPEAMTFNTVDELLLELES